MEPLGVKKMITRFGYEPTEGRAKMLDDFAEMIPIRAPTRKIRCQ